MLQETTKQDVIIYLKVDLREFETRSRALGKEFELRVFENKGKNKFVPVFK
jgi:deoxyadenosine/deoxycytidine kinase